MHDVHRDSIIQKNRKKGTKQERGHSHGEDHSHAERGEHEAGMHSHQSQDNSRSHNDGHRQAHTDHRGHDHKHDEAAFVNHESDLHVHSHKHEQFEDRAFSHLHEHGHFFYHGHHHTHDPSHSSLAHRIFKDPVRDWFAVVLMGLLIVAGYRKWLPGHLSEGMIVCAAIIGIFPLLKNALFECIAAKKFSFELLVGILLVGGLFMGRFIETALICLLLLMGSFMRLNFSWRND